MPEKATALAPVSLDDKYDLERGRVYLTGTQALVRLLLMQRRRDRAAGLNTGGFVSGYRGSPVGAVDRELWKIPERLAAHHVHFQLGVNEDLAATAVWGSQQVNLFPGARYDGVFALWYGKGPGLDRCGDVMRHANAFGTSRYGGVLAVVGDDHALKSTSQPAHGEPMFIDMQMPVLYPANVQEMLDLGLQGWALSRFTGAWVGFKVLADTMDSSTVVEVAPDWPEIVLPGDVEMPADGVHIRWPDPWDRGEVRQHLYKLPAAVAFARANAINRVDIAPERPRLGIVTAGKSWLDVRQALSDLGLDARQAAEAGVAVLKLGMPWPLDQDLIRQFGDGLEQVLVIEEKRQLLESGVRDALYDLPDGRRPKVFGRYDESGTMQLAPMGEHSPDDVARAIARRLRPLLDSDELDARINFLERRNAEEAAAGPELTRTAYFCSGCPHNSSTKVPDGSRAIAGVGCHFMAVMTDRNTETFTHMGGEGAPWIGQAPFTRTPHVFANMGEGTYYHSASLAVRACIAAGVNITYKILFNDAVAMTGGQPLDGPLTVPMIARQMAAEGVTRIAVVSDEPDKYPLDAGFPAGTSRHHRDDLDAVQRDLRELPGVTVLIYDQTCAAEKRRRRKRGSFPDPDRRIFINEDVCEGCGDCHVASNCLSVVPVDTEFGKKRMIDQSSCNKDFSCANGFCPSFVVVHGGRPRPRLGKEADEVIPAALPTPDLPALPAPGNYAIMVTGIGGTGVVTISALIGMAAHLEGKTAAAVDMLGMSQKGGAVVSHIRIAGADGAIHSPRLNAGAANLLLGADLLASADPAVLDTVRSGHTRALVNSHQTITGAFTIDPDLDFPAQRARDCIVNAAGREQVSFLDATRLAGAILGDAIATNMFLFGHAWQQGTIPLGLAAIERAIELNGVAVEANRRAFRLGRWAAVDLPAVQALAGDEHAQHPDHRRSQSLDELIARRFDLLTRYQDAAYAQRYVDRVEAVRAAERRRAPGRSGLGEAVARGLFKLMRYKDEYEVARLYSDPRWRAQLAEQLDGAERLELLLAPPLVSQPDPRTGRVATRRFGPWIFPVLGMLARLRRLRGTIWDPFGRSEERRTERALIGEYDAIIDELLDRLDLEHHALAVEIAKVPEQIRGYGHVKAGNIAAARAEWQRLLGLWRSGHTLPRAAE